MVDLSRRDITRAKRIRRIVYGTGFAVVVTLTSRRRQTETCPESRMTLEPGNVDH